MDLLSGTSRSSTWAERLVLNVISYSIILFPVAFLVFITKLRLLPSKFGNSALIQLFVYGYVRTQSTKNTNDYLDQQRLLQEDDLEPEQSHISKKQSYNYVKFCGCFFGLQFSYLIWGILQEKIMTTKYVINPISQEMIYNETTQSKTPSANLVTFHDSQFLVFLNRITAFVVSIFAILCNQPARSSSNRQSTKHNAPLYEFIYCSLSNILSSWCQYEALKYVNFPTQVLSKSCKVIPVMLMSTIIMRKKYMKTEYLRASILSFGMFIFLLNQSHKHAQETIEYSHQSSDLSNITNHDNSTKTWRESIINTPTTSGLLILALYLFFDSFTSNWQSNLFSKYAVSEWQMMAATNFYSILLTLTSLHQLGHLSPAISLLVSSKSLSVDCIAMSLASSIGQLFVFYTIKQFGSVVFAVIMTLRQLFAFIISCKLFTHELTIGSLLGVFVIFSVIFWETSLKLKKNKQVSSS